MKTLMTCAAGLFLSGSLMGCSLTPYDGDPNTVIARGYDRGIDSGTLPQQQAAIAYDPDGCQNWLLDDGVEGYASPRFDPVSGLPVCNDQFPPGAVVREYRTTKSVLADFVPN